ncbi:hypothetical protein ABGB19_25110 [Mycobacterium sp. B14F4]|uniref:hypothetical protein n=1 Tax=Mycobacterium sp. B14F4 TaxID=3153565 RepID=UPI00325F3F58
MEQLQPRSPLDHAGDQTLRRIIVTAAVVLIAVILAAVAIYAAAFLMLAPMMQ